MSNRKNPDPERRETHPSYVMVGLYRTSGGIGRRQLFGSALNHHVSTMRLRVVRAERTLGDAHDRYFGHENVVEIEMSMAQFAELITAQNVGSGVPATLRYLGNERIEDPPLVETETERMRNDFTSKVQDMIIVGREQSAAIMELVKSLGAKTKRQIEINLEVITQQVSSNAPFFVDMFHEAAERVVTAAKTEIEAFTMHVLHAAGMEAIADGQLPKLLAGSISSKKEDPSDG